MVQQGWAGRLRSVLGRSPEELVWPDLAALVGSAVEADDLDFKRDLYGNADADKQELAADVASFANHRGGLILIGVDEVDGVVEAILPVALSDAEDARMRQVIASRLSLFLDYELSGIPTDDDPSRGCYALIVAPSSGRPHAVLNGVRLSYPRRDGTTKRWLSEAEVADLYAERFRGDDARLVKSESVQLDLIADLSREARAWLVLSLVPSRASTWEINRTSVQQITDWASRFQGADLLRGVFPNPPRAVPAMRRLVLSNLYEEAPPFSSTAAHLHTDGAGAVAVTLGWDPRADIDDVAVVHRDHLLVAVTGSLNLVARHAIENCAGYGEALIRAELRSDLPMGLFHSPRGFLERSDNGRQVKGPIISNHSYGLESLDSPQGLLAAARGVLSDLTHALGSAEVYHLTPDGTIRHRYFNASDQIEAWAEKHGVAVTAETI